MLHFLSCFYVNLVKADRFISLWEDLVIQLFLNVNSLSLHSLTTPQPRWETMFEVESVRQTYEWVFPSMHLTFLFSDSNSMLFMYQSWWYLQIRTRDFTSQSSCPAWFNTAGQPWEFWEHLY